jgi:putative membrane protein
VRLNGSGLAEISAAALRPRRAWLLAVGVVLLAALLAANDAGAVARAVMGAGWRVLAVIAAHLPVVFAAAIAWAVLIPPDQRPSMPESCRLRWIKESVNGLLPVGQVGGDIVRAQLAVSERLPAREAAASCIVDAATGLVSLVLFLIVGLTVGMVAIDDPRLLRMGAPLVAAGGAVVLLLVFAGRLGLLRLVDKAVSLSRRAFNHLEGLGDAISAMTAQRRRVAASVGWHLVGWLFGVVETAAALWAIGLASGFDRALVLESTAQAARALGFLVPGALGVQEGGYLVISGMLGIPADQALALSLLRRGRELALGSVGLVVWRLSRPRNAGPMEPAPRDHGHL